MQLMVFVNQFIYNPGMLWHFFEHRSSMEAILAFNSLYPKQITNKKFKHSCERLESSTFEG